MTLVGMIVALLCGLAPPDGVADVVTLRDGKAVRGQVMEPSPAGKLRVVLRREWLEEALPDRAAIWVPAAEAASRLAGSLRRSRLAEWRRERPANANDPVSRWLDDQLAAPRGVQEETLPLLIVDLDARQIARVSRADREGARLLRQAWRAKFDDPETRPRDELKERLEGRGFAMSDVDPAPIGDLTLPVTEPEALWRARRAATEVKDEPSLRFVRYGDLVLPENASTTGLGGVSALSQVARSMLGSLADELPAEDAMTPFLKAAESRGRAGAVLTVLHLSEDMTSVRVESALLVRVRPGRWMPAVHRVGQGRSGADPLKADPAADALAADPQVQAVFRVVEGLGLNALGPEVRRRSLNVGAATRAALGEAQSALWREIEALAMPVGREP